jgi:glycerol-3-phosphate dehydrogenase
MSSAGRLGPEQRGAALDRLADEPFDIVVIGGGVTGFGCALDAATRGLSVALIEQRDIASGTSSRSSKLIHGGLRYLERFDFKLVREALIERGLLLTKLAPHLVKPVSFLYPLRHRVWERAYVGSGVMLYDLLAAQGTNPLPVHRHLSHRGMLEIMPAIDGDRFVGALQYWDAEADDARFTLAVARSAAAHGAVIAPSVRATGFLQRGGHRVEGVEAVDLESGRELTIRARAVINATGVWSDLVETFAGERTRNVTASKGIHLVVPRDRIDSETGLITKTERSVLFIIPFGGHWLIGTTDTPWDLGLAHPAASRTDIDYLLGHANTVLADPLDHEDVTGVYAGLRPLVTGDAESTAKLSREHAITHPAPGLVTIAGGKWTTYRVMAADTVNTVAESFANPIPESRTEEVPLHGSAGYHHLWEARRRIAADSGLPLHQIERLLGRYGSDVDDLLALIEEQPELGRPLPGAENYLAAEVQYAATHEAALHLSDVLTRRTRISIEVPDRGLTAAEASAEILAPVLGWDDAATERELAHYRARVAAERESQTMPDDNTADSARLGAPDVRTRGYHADVPPLVG